jgi:hypothetical protein
MKEHLVHSIRQIHETCKRFIDSIMQKGRKETSELNIQPFIIVDKLIVLTCLL